MEAGLQPPILSTYDPVVESEGSVDPLSLQRTYERLADRILPALTVRMGRPRFVTAIAVGAHICGQYDDDAVAADGVTPPWLVFEWFVVEAMFRCRDEMVDARGVPGLLKVQAALRTSRPVNASAYLKTPKIFGFTGIYKRLVTALNIVTDELHLDDAGFEIVQAWERDQKLDGFLDGRSGEGAAFRECMRHAVQAGMSAGRTVSRSPDFWHDLMRRLQPAQIGLHERRAIDRYLRNPDGVKLHLREASCMTRELIEALERHGEPIARAQEARFCRRLRSKASPELRLRLDAIDTYEALCRPITDAFYLVRHLSTQHQGRAVGESDFSNHKAAASLAKSVEVGVDAIRRHDVLRDWEPDVQHLVDAYTGVRSPASLFRAVLEHHEQAQHEKPPDGKRPWLERTRDDRVIVRPAYAVDGARFNTTDYTHEYRLPTLSRFLVDLGRLS